MFTLVRKIIERLKFLPVGELTTAERQIFQLLSTANLMTVNEKHPDKEVVDTGLQFPDTVPVLTRNGQLEIEVEIPKTWTHQLECHGLIRAISGTVGGPISKYTWLGKEK